MRARLSLTPLRSRVYLSISLLIISIEKMNKLIKGYETRMKDYILKMAQKPIIIKKQKDKYSTSRQELLATSSNKILDKKGFQFKSGLKNI